MSAGNPVKIMAGHFYYGDNLAVMRERIADDSVDLIYLDPPFKSDADYNMLFAGPGGVAPAESQVQAFEDTWQWGAEARREFDQVCQDTPDIGVKLQAMRSILGECGMLAYLSRMTIRLTEMRRVLKPNGSIYLHCDPTASHYLKVMMDAVFHPVGGQLRSEIIWRIGWVSGFKTRKRGWIRNHDTILYYAMGNKFTFNKEYIPYPDGYRRRDGSPPTGVGIPIEDTWNCNSGDVLDSIMIKSFSREKLGYPTQKPLALLRRIIRASSNPGDVVLDPFCGCGTACHAAAELGRDWIGIDITALALPVLQARFEASAMGADFTVTGMPASSQDWRLLASGNPMEFERAAISLIYGCRPYSQRRGGGDTGMDGLIPIATGRNQWRFVVVSVKGGAQLNPSMVRDLRGVMERESKNGIIAGALVTAHPITAGMRRELESAGDVDILGKSYPKLQAVTIDEILSRKAQRLPELALPLQVAAPLDRLRLMPEEAGGQYTMDGIETRYAPSVPAYSQNG